MKKLITAISICLLTNLSISQNGWFYQNCGITSAISDIYFINAQTGWIVSDSVIVKTTNGGTNWSQISVASYKPLHTIHFINENTGWAAGGYYGFPGIHYGQIIRTTNGGNSWNVISNTGEVCDLIFFDVNTGFIGIDASGDFVAGGYIRKTTNGGSNWNGDYSHYRIVSLSFTNISTGYALGHYWDDTGHDSSKVFGTVNSGLSWEIKYKKTNLPFNNSSLKRIFAYGNNVWITGRDSFIVFSSNSGLNWTNQTIPDHKVKNSIFFIDENTGWAVGNNFYDTENIIKTTNSGKEWFQLRNSYNNPLLSVFFVDQYTGWAAGNNGVVLKTVTGGLTSASNSSVLVIKDSRLYQNYPNPFNPVTSIFYHLNHKGFVKIKIFDVYGRELKTLVDKSHNEGSYKIEFNAANFASGIYFCMLEVNNSLIDYKKLVLLK